MKDINDYYLHQFLEKEILAYSITYHVHWRGVFIWVFFRDRFSRSKTGVARVRWGEACDLLQVLAEIEARWENGKLFRVVRDENDRLCLAPIL